MKSTPNCVRFAVVPVPRKSLAKYKKMAKVMAKVWRDYGALSYAEYIEDDVEGGKVTSFPQSVKLKKGEVVVVSVATFKSNAVAQRGIKKMMNDPRLTPFMDPKAFPFDGMRMYWGGFKKMFEV